MLISTAQKEGIKQKIREKLAGEPEVRKIVLFGSFLTSEQPNDIDIAIFQNSNEKYLPLALKYRKLVREIAKILPVDIIPLKAAVKGTLLHEIDAGEILYER
ncbi:MAG: nucleotidyltransferase domain-containing protein [Candidatus Electrothrix sp.]